MFYEDFQVGRVTEIGTAAFTREGIRAYAEQYDPRVLEADHAGKELFAPGLLIASECMRRFVDWHAAFCAVAAERGEARPSLGVSPGLRDLRWRPVRPGDVVTVSIRTISMRLTSKPRWGLVGNTFTGRDQRRDEALFFSSLVFAFRRSAETTGE